MTTPVLEVSELTVRFGGIVAVQQVSLTVNEGELVGLIGPNGAGKTTLIDAVTGFAPYEGSVLVAGDCIDGLRPDQRVARGLGRTFQSLELFEDLTVRENLSVGHRSSMRSLATALAQAGLGQVADRLPSTLSPGMRGVVALARASAAEQRVLLLDEVAAGMDRLERSSLAEHLREIVSSGSSVLLVDHDLGLVADLSQRVIVLDAGRVIASGSPEEIRRNEQVLGAYLGRR